MTIEHKVGWGFPLNSKKAHWFVANQSLCGKWLFGGPLEDDANSKSADNCAACWKRLHPGEKKRTWERMIKESAR